LFDDEDNPDEDKNEEEKPPSTPEINDESITDAKKDVQEDEEFYISHKRNKIKTKFIPDYHYNANSNKMQRLPAWKLNKPQKVNTVIENY
jgi:hypothetical protein